MSISSGPSSSTVGPAFTGLGEALTWYDHQAQANRAAYQGLRLAAIVLAAAIPVVTTSGAPRIVAAILGSAIVVVEGIQQVFRFHERYIGYRSTWNLLDREQRLYQARAGRYSNNPSPDQSLAERVDQILAEENTSWAADMRTTQASPGH